MSAARTINVMIRLLPSIVALRRDRRLWIKSSGTRVDTAGFRRNAARALDAFIALGPVYIKLGQWLSSRADILPQPYLEEMSKLQDSVPSAPFDQIRPIIEEELGPIRERFDEIDPDPISGASLGQVYRGSVSGRQIVIKVRRPGIEKTVDQDLRILRRILPLALRFVDRNFRYSAKAMLEQFTETMREEMDYAIESENLKRIRQDVDPDLAIVPDVLDDLSTKNVLTMEYMPGIKVTDVEALDRQGIDRERLVADVHRVFFTMLLKHSVFHADPHPGNISVADDGRLILYDFGMVGRISERTRLMLIRLYLALVEKNPPRVVDMMNDLGMLTPGFNRRVMERGIDISIRAMHGQKPDEMEVNSLMELSNRTMSRFPFVLPKNLALYIRMASIIEGIYKTHDIDFRFVRVLRDILREEELLPRAYMEELRLLVENLSRSVGAAVRLGPEMEDAMDEVRAYVRRGRSSVLIGGSIFSSAVFIGSVMLYAGNETLGTAGIVCSCMMMAASVLFGRR